MPSETKADIIAKIAEFGETAPSSHTVMQLKSQLALLKQEARDSGAFRLKQALVNLNKAAKKKAVLIEFVNTNCPEVKLSPNMTIPQIYGVAEKNITLQVPPHSADKMGFGRHGDLTYGEVRMEHASYCEWALKISEEEETNWRLARFVKWLKNQAAEPEMIPAVTPPSRKKAAPWTSPPSGKGYSKAMASSGTESEGWQAVTPESTSMLLEMKEELDALRKENADLYLQMGRSKSRKETWEPVNLRHPRLS